MAQRTGKASLSKYGAVFAVFDGFLNECFLVFSPSIGWLEDTVKFRQETGGGVAVCFRVRIFNWMADSVTRKMISLVFMWKCCFFMWKYF